MKKIKKIALIVVPVLILILGIFCSKQEWSYFVNLVLMLTEMGLIFSSFDEKHNALKYVLITALCFLVFTWLIPAATFSSGEFVNAELVQMGMFEMFNYSFTAMSYFGHIAIFVLLVGAFYGIMYKIPAYRNFLDRIVNTENGKKYFSLAAVGCISLVILLFANLLAGCKLKLWIYFALGLGVVALVYFAVRWLTNKAEGTKKVFAIIMLVVAVGLTAFLLINAKSLVYFLAVIPLIIVYLLFKLITSKEGKNMLFMSIMMVIIAFTVSVCGIQLALLLFFPILVSLILLMGYDKVTAAMVTVGSSMIGIMGSTYAFSNTKALNSLLNLGMNSELLTKFIILAIGLILLIFNVKLYIGKKGLIKEKKIADKNMKKDEPKVIKTSAKKNNSNSKSSAAKSTSKVSKTSKSNSKSTKKSSGSKNKASRRDYKAAAKDDEVIVAKVVNDDDSLIPTADSNSKHVIWPFVVSFALFFVVIILAFMSWGDAFNIDAFTKATSAVTSYELFEFPIFAKILGSVNAFGNWSLLDYACLMVVATLFICVVYKVKINDVFEGLVSGMKKALPIAVIVIVLYTCLVLTTWHPFQLTLYKFILGAGSKMKLFKIFTMSLTGILAAFFNVEPLYAAQSVVPYLTSLKFSENHFSMIAVIYQSLYGLTMLIAPTSVVLVSVLSYLNISIKKWFKAVWKLLLELLVALLIIFIILLLI